VPAIFIAMFESQIPFGSLSKESKIVFFTGAGISAESGISTFRDTEGHWSKYDPMKLASPSGFKNDPDLVLGWYGERRRTALHAKPNAGHASITQFQKLFSNSVVITQNVDGLHKRAGNHSILELHGNIHRQKCFKCGVLADAGKNIKDSIDYCSCGGMLRPDVVWFGENLSGSVLNEAFQAAEDCALLFSIGTSTQVYPAAQLPFTAQQNGAFIIEINPEPTPFSSKANLSLRDQAGEILPKLYEEFNAALS